MLVQKSTRSFFFAILRTKHKQILPNLEVLIQQKLTKDEENVMRYIGGYIMSRLPRKVKIVKNLENIIENMKQGSAKEASLSYTTEWMGLQNRGGLCNINNPAFSFFANLNLF